MENMGFELEEEEFQDLLDSLSIDGELLFQWNFEFMYENCWEFIYLELCKNIKKQRDEDPILKNSSVHTVDLIKYLLYISC